MGLDPGGDQVTSEPRSGSGLIVLIPTRNRGDFLANALRSVAAQGADDVHVVVSDNSTTPADVERSRAAVDHATNPDVRYVRPATPLAMAEHWDWALGQALAAVPAAGHVFVLTDRMVFTRHGLRRLQRVIRAHPDEIIACDHERIDDWVAPVRYERSLSTGRRFRVPSRRVLDLAARMMIHESFPRMLNCAVPRDFLLELWRRRGSFFASRAPDFNFGFRSLALRDHYVFLDDKVLVHYGLARSNGASASRGVDSSDSRDFREHLGAAGFPCAPIPELFTTANAIANEYLFARREAGAGSFPPLDTGAYLAANAKEIHSFIDPQVRRQALSRLQAHGPATDAAGGGRVGLLSAWGRTAIHRLVTRRRGLRFPSTAEALEHVMGPAHGRRSLLGGLRALPYRLFLVRLLSAIPLD